MYKIYQKISVFNKNILTLMMGNIISQAIPIAISPILTRIYTPEDFGIFAVYMSLVSMVAVFATGRYELAVMLPKHNKEAINILFLSILISFCISCFLFLIILIFNSEIVNMLGNKKLSNWLYFVPFSVFLVAIYQIFNYWINRNKRYKLLAKNKIIQSATTSFSNLLLGFAKIFQGGLILSGILGQFVATLFLFKNICKNDMEELKKITKFKIFYVANKYKKFPKLDIISSLLNTSSHQIISILFNSFFNSIFAGYFYLVQRMLGVPISIVSTSVLDVFKEVASREYALNKSAKTIFISTFKKLLLISLLPTLFLYFFVVDIFAFIFGQEWLIAGEYAKILLPMMFFQFISGPLSFMFYIAQKQELNLYCQAVLFFLVLMSFYLSDNAYSTIVCLSFSFSIFYVVQIVLSAKMAKVF